MTARVVVTRLDSAGDVLLAGPAIRAVSQAADVTLLCSHVGLPAARLLPGIRTLTFDAPWVHGEPPPLRARELGRLLWRLRGFDEGIILTSSFQSSLPMAMLMRLAGIGTITAISDHYPGSLIDNRVHVDYDVHELQRNLATVAAAGYPGNDAYELKALTPYPLPDRPYVVVHPGADAKSRAIEPALAQEAVAHLLSSGYDVVVTGSLTEKRLTAQVAGGVARDLGGRTTFAQLGYVLAHAEAVVAGNTGAGHLAASVGTPVVSLFAPVVPVHKWAPYGVRATILGDQHAACADTRARQCPVPGHPCMRSVTGTDIAAAVRGLTLEVAA
jgi:ADP-heptose:LPS heptosyltransferase